jgi:hypothetical protein
VIFDIVEYIIMQLTMPNESRICRRVLILKKKRRVLLASLPRSSIGQKRIAGPEKLNREDYGVDKYGSFFLVRLMTKARQNKLEIPRDKDEVNNREIHECDGRSHDPDTMVVPLTPKPTRKAEALVRVPPTIASCHEEDAALRKWPLPRYCCASCILF